LVISCRICEKKTVVVQRNY